MLTLYHCKSSYASQIVRLFLEAYSIPWQSQHIDLRKQEHILSDYRLVNPKCTVPALVDDKLECTITNSTDILIHLVNNYIDSSFKPGNELLTEMIDFCRKQEAFHDPYLRLLSYAFIFLKKDSIDKAKLDNLLAVAKKHPNKERGAFLINLVEGNISNDELSDAKQAVTDYLRKLDKLLSANQYSNYLFGSKNISCFTMADAAAISALFRIIKLGMLEEIQQHRRVYDYYEKINNTAYFKSAELC